ncbi:MAG: hypothetical protein J6B53_02340 [Clostridia bacterium]|nr:hypothetical protein [Clostridia bacterium]
MNTFRIGFLIGMIMLVFQFCSVLSADASEISKGWALFGTYYYESDGARQPVLWRILGAGVPEFLDITTESNNVKYDEKNRKHPNGDPVTEENDDLVCMMTEYIIDYLLYNDFRDVADKTPPLDYQNCQLHQTLQNQVLGDMFTREQISVLEEMPGRGYIAPPSRLGELFRADYGFVEEDFVACKKRIATGTPYAYKKGLKRIGGHSWYWTSDWRRYGSRWIVGDDGHISVSGVDRAGGVRLICYLHTDRIQAVSGKGTMDDPWILDVLSPSAQIQSSSHPAIATNSDVSQ